jgi:hypothetical protein
LARLFSLTRPALMQLAWFARVFTRWMNWKTRLLLQVRDSWPWRLGRIVKHRMRQRWQRLKNHWDSA